MELGIDRKRVKQAFAQYVRQYNAKDEKILLKIRHTYRVAEISERIAAGLGLSAYDKDLAWLIGMLHDIGRFEQLRQYGTFVDADSIDHAHFGVKLLFREGLIRDYVDSLTVDSNVGETGKMDGESAGSDVREAGEEDGISVDSDAREAGEEDGISVDSDARKAGEKDGISVDSDASKAGEKDGISACIDAEKMDRVSLKFDAGRAEKTDREPVDFTAEEIEKMVGDLRVIQVAIWNHSAYRIEEGLDERTLLFCRIIRDADKVDILKVAYDTPMEVLYRCTLEEFQNAAVTSEVIKAYQEGHAVLRNLKKTPVDFLVGHIALVFELEFPFSRKIAREQGYIQKLLSFQSNCQETVTVFKDMRRQMEDFLLKS